VHHHSSSNDDEQHQWLAKRSVVHAITYDQHVRRPGKSGTVLLTSPAS
jgi:hypothetical protein